MAMTDSNAQHQEQPAGVVCPACGRASIMLITGLEQIVAEASSEADYCVVEEGVQGIHIHVHQRGGRWMAHE